MGISAGWRMEEDEQPRVLEQLGVEVTHLPLYRWYEQIKRAELAVHRVHAARQVRIRALKRHYQIQMNAAMDALRRIMDTRVDDADLQRESEQLALAHLKSIDELFVQRIETWDEQNVAQPWTQKIAATGHAQARRALRGAKAVLIAGGHVGVLHTRMHFFGLPPLLREALDSGVSIIAWSAGAMALSERVVLYDDESPQGDKEAELFGAGFGLMPQAVFLPYATSRLDLGAPGRVSRFARRFAPSLCIGLESGAALEWKDGCWSSFGDIASAPVLQRDGYLGTLQEAR